MKLCCNFSLSLFVQMLLLVVVVVVPPDLCKSSERASERAMAQQKSNRTGAAVDLRMGPAPLPPCLPPSHPFD
jgi:hypothetical protein